MDLGDFGERRTGLVNEGLLWRIKLRGASHNLSGTFLLGPDRKDSNGSQF